jgi:lipid-A-disaccharide synthase-like uncharacterized protein
VRNRKTAKLMLILIATSLPLMWIGWRLSSDDDQSSASSLHSVRVPLQIDGAKRKVDLVQNDNGSYTYHLTRGDGASELLTPDQLADRLYRQQSGRTVLQTIFNISSPIGMIWVSVGLLGQVLFTGRMVVQWLASEKNRKSVVPPLFWWMSLAGALMLLSYFLWRQDVVGVLGQSFGLFIYLRNLRLIYKEQKRVAIIDDPAPEPELG